MRGGARPELLSVCALSGVGGHVSKDVTAESLDLLFLVTMDRLQDNRVGAGSGQLRDGRLTGLGVAGDGQTADHVEVGVRFLQRAQLCGQIGFAQCLVDGGPQRF